MKVSKNKPKRKKKGDTKSKVSLGESSIHPIQYIYKLMAMMGVANNDENKIATKYEVGSSHLSIAIPSIKFGLSLPGDKTDKLIEDGWHIEPISVNDLEPFKRIFNSVEAGRVAAVYSKASPNAKTTSKPEEKIYSEIIRRGLPTPDRNLRIKRKDGTELTTPDFSWKEEKVAFFMDGAYWHSVAQDQEIIKEIKEKETFGKKIISDRKDKVKKDQRIRSDLTVMGWTVLSCTDEEITTQKGVEEQVKNISEVLKRQRDIKRIGRRSAEDIKEIDEIINSHDS